MFCLCLVSSYQTSWHKKAPAFLEEAQGCHACDISDWKRCRIKHNESPTLFVRGHYLFCFCLIRFPVLCLQKRNESRIDVCQLLFIALSLPFYSDKHLKSDGFIFTTNHIQKNVVLNIRLLVFAAFHSHAEKQTE